MHDGKFCTVRDDSKGTTDIAVCYADVKAGDLVVCDYGYGNGKLSVRRVLELKEDDVTYPYEAIVIGVVDTHSYDNYKEYKRKKTELEQQMSNLVKNIEKELYYEYIAKNNDTFAKLYNEYKTLLSK